MHYRNHRRKGNATIEMTMIGIPIMCVLLSTFELARGIWTYHTMAYALKEGTRYAVVHGQDCNPAVNALQVTSCQVTVGQIATVIQNAAVGLDPTQFQVELDPNNLSGLGLTTLVPLSTLLSNSSTFPAGTGAAQQALITFIAEYPFRSAVVMFWPGRTKGFSFASFTLPASSQEKVQF